MFWLSAECTKENIAEIESKGEMQTLKDYYLKMVRK